MPTRCPILLVPGSLRRASTNLAVLRTASAVAPEGVETDIYEGAGMLPHFNPDDDADPVPAGVADLREQIRSAHAVVFSVPEYAGALPGTFKNLLDWTIGDDRPGSIYEKPVAWINAAPRGAAQAHEQLRQVLGYAHATIVERACVHVPVTATMIDPDGLVADAAVRACIVDALGMLSDP